MLTTNLDVIKIAKIAFPSYNGKRFQVEAGRPTSLPCYWEGGSKDNWCFVDMATHKTRDVATNHPLFEPDRPSVVPADLPENVAIVKHAIFCGKDMGLTVYVHPNAITPFLPAPAPELTENQAKALSIICGLVSGARKEAARRIFGNLATYETLKAELREKGLVNDKLNQSTMDGKNLYMQKYFQKFIL